jgi:hypothetical protein
MRKSAICRGVCLILLFSAQMFAQGKQGDMPERTMEALRAVIAEGIASKSPRIVIPPGRYKGGPAISGHTRLAPGNVHLLINNLTNTEIIADGVTMLCTDFTRAITFSNCKNVEVRGLVVDYDPLPFTQGDIMEVNGS